LDRARGSVEISFYRKRKMFCFFSFPKKDFFYFRLTRNEVNLVSSDKRYVEFDNGFVGERVFSLIGVHLNRCEAKRVCNLHGSERVGREEEGTRSGRAEIGAYSAILRHTPEHEDLVTTTDSEVLCRLVSRWVGQGGKTSLANIADADILEYILMNLEARILAKSRTFLVKVKAHRGEPLNEGADDRDSRTMAKKRMD